MKLADLKAGRCAIGELKLLVQATDGVHNLGVAHACPGPLTCVHLPQHHSKSVHIYGPAQTTCHMQPKVSICSTMQSSVHNTVMLATAQLCCVCIHKTSCMHRQSKQTSLARAHARTCARARTHTHTHTRTHTHTHTHTHKAKAPC